MEHTDQTSAADEDIARLLRAAGPRERLPADMRQRWDRHFRAELAPVTRRRAGHRRQVILGLCAALLVAAGTLLTYRLPPATPAVDIRVSHSSGATRGLLPGGSETTLRAGQRLTSGSMVSTGDDGHLALTYGSHELRLNRRTRLRFADGRIALEAGEIYASDREAQGPRHPLRIATRHGTVRDVGTQFTVAVFPDQTVTTVRRGAVLIDTGRGELRAEAGPDGASRLTIDRDRQVHSESVAPGGSEWRWIYRAGAGFELDGRTAYEFLAWSVGESGLRLEFASPGAEIYARTTRLHGDISTLDPEQAVAPVLASTDLVAEPVAQHTLRVTLQRPP